MATSIGRYDVLQTLGQGGMATLYLAHDPRIDRRVAIKVLREGTDSPEIRERFAREARAIGALTHPNIVTIYDYGEQDGQLYIVMEYVSGTTLAEIIRTGPDVTLGRKLEIVEAVCSGLAYAHGLGVVHRDVKPANVMVSEAGGVKILDFGIAQLARLVESDMTQPGVIFGTFNYLSPEMATGTPVDHRADVFGVGSILYELVSGRKLYPGSPTDVLRRLVNGEHEPLSQAWPEAPSALDAIVEKSIAIRPDDRYQDLLEMAADLARCGRDLPDAERTTPRPPSADPEAAEPPDATVVGITKAVADPPTPSPDSVVDGTIFLADPRAARGSGEPAVDARLLVSHCPDPHQDGRSIPVPNSGVTLGRDAGCDVRIAGDHAWSRHHARIDREQRGFVIRDLGSQNGTFVNGRRLQADVPEPLYFGAMIAIGETTLTFAYGHETALPDLTGTEIAGRYRLESRIRDSAKAAVYVANDRNVPRRVAIKLLSPALARFEEYRALFEREASLAARLQHPHVCQVLDSGVARVMSGDGEVIATNFVCYELMEGRSLSERLTRGDPPSQEQITRWIAMLGAALVYVHAQSVVHGDLKPSAIVFDAAGNLYLTDFAIAQNALTEGRAMLGSPPFVAPELWEGGPVTPATDQFAFAALAYYMLTGSRPFEGQDNPHVRQKNFRQGPIAAHDEARQNGWPLVTRAASDVLGRALAIQPAHRFASVDQFSAALLKALSGGRATGAEPFIFISYDRELSGGWVRFFADRLMERHGVRVFVDTVGLDRAGRFPPRLRRAIEGCDVFVAFLAGRTLQSRWVVEEIRMAHDLRKLMIPVFQESYEDPADLDEGTPVHSLISHHGVRLFDVSGYYVDQAVAELARLVKDAPTDDADP